MPDKGNVLSRRAYDHILDRLISDSEFRQLFGRSPVAAVQSAGIELQEDDIRALQELMDYVPPGGKSAFDERLVLCSSSGY